MNKILLADDSLTIQKVVELTFMDEDYDVEAVGSGEAVLARLGEGRPDILIADIHMPGQPGQSGYDICRHAKAHYPGLPVLLLVGTFETLDEEELRRSGADGHLKKPFDSQELLQTVAGLVAGAATREAAALVPGFETTAHAEPAPLASPAPPSPAPAERGSTAAAELTDQDLERIARRVVELLGDRVLRDVAWEVLPDLAEVVVRERLRELEAQVE